MRFHCSGIGNILGKHKSSNVACGALIIYVSAILNMLWCSFHTNLISALDAHGEGIVGLSVYQMGQAVFEVRESASLSTKVPTAVTGEHQSGHLIYAHFEQFITRQNSHEREVSMDTTGPTSTITNEKNAQ